MASKSAVETSQEVSLAVKQYRNGERKAWCGHQVPADEVWYVRGEVVCDACYCTGNVPAAAVRDPDHLNPAEGGNRAGDDYW